MQVPVYTPVLVGTVLEYSLMGLYESPLGADYYQRHMHSFLSSSLSLFNFSNPFFQTFSKVRVL